MNRRSREIVLYFANWNLNKKKAACGGEVASIPWDCTTYINHAFWAVAPLEDTEETSFTRRDLGKSARENFTIRSMRPEFDLDDDRPSELIPNLKKNHFDQYAYFSKLYPNVRIMISIGGWARCGYFSEMAYTQKGRTSFVNSCIELINKYPWIGGIDIDWEYPGCSLNGERLPDPNADDGDEGCPIWGTVKEDSINLSKLLKELRQALDDTYGVGTKALTACAGASTESILPCQDWASIAANLDIINIMTYDMAGVWDGVTGHASSLAGTKKSVEYLTNLGIPESKLCIGTPLYAIAFKLKDPASIEKLNVPCCNYRATDMSITEKECGEFQALSVEDNIPGWHHAMDESQGGTYLYNDDPSSEYYGWLLSYEDTKTLQDKLDYINNTDLAGIIIWESSQDTSGHDFLKQMAENLL